MPIPAHAVGAGAALMMTWYLMKLGAQWRHVVLVETAIGPGELRKAVLKWHLDFVDQIYGDRGELKPLWQYV